ncbi:MAG: cobalamin-binding protein [Syntrophus sp. SKADARSKE-3]|nr:cobalamin-binding protein [Syntrophus sp. SKADARSKE-3]
MRFSSKNHLLFIFCLLFFCETLWAKTPDRIVSLAPSITEVLYELGMGDRIVGVTDYCDYPLVARQKPKVGGIVNPSLEAIVAAKPDLVIVSNDVNPRNIIERLGKHNIRTHIFSSRKISYFPEEVRKLGIILDARAQGNRLANVFEVSLRRLQTKAKKGGSHLSRKVLFIIQPEPLIVAGPGTAIHEAVTILGMTNIVGSSPMPYPKYSLEFLYRHPPDAIFICRGNGMEARAGGLFRKLRDLPAVKEGHVYYLSDALFRVGPRTISGMEEVGGKMGIFPP